MKRSNLCVRFFTLAVICIIGMAIVSPAVAATGVKTFRFSPKAIESRVDCLITYLRQELQIEVPKDFKAITGIEELLKQMGSYEVKSEEEQRALNEAVRRILEKLLTEFKGSDEYRRIILSMLNSLEKLPEGYCEPEAYEAEGPLRISGRDLLEEREEYKDDPAPSPTPTPEEGNFIFYGKKYTLPEDLTPTGNGLLLLSNEDFILDEDSGEWSNYPPTIAPLWVLTLDEQIQDGRVPIANVFDPPEVSSTDSFHRYAYPGENFSATLYTNPQSAESDWIAFGYGDVNLPQDAFSVLVGLSPGDGKQGHPGPGESRSLAVRSDWFGVDLSEETGESFTNDPGSYLTIGEGFIFFNPFDLEHSFLVFRPDGNDRYTVTAGSRKMVVDSVGLDDSKTSLDMAIENVRDETLLSRVDSADFTPSTYTYGLQAPSDADTVDRLNSNGFLAYAVQVEEDRLNKEILEMYQHSVKDEIRRDNIRNALEAGDIRARDALLTQEADAQAGRVTRDHEGNWVRAQQYILRPDAKTVKVLNVCLRGQDAGDLSGLSTMDFTTVLKEDYRGDLRDLPWGKWLDTINIGEAGYRAVETERQAPELDTMYIKLSNSEGESLKEQRDFGARWDEDIPPIDGVQYDALQFIEKEILTIDASGFSAQYTFAQSGPNTYHTEAYGNGFKYMTDDGKQIAVSFYLAEDGDDSMDQVESAEPYTQSVRNIWDALRVNEPGAPSIGNNNLEISIDETGAVFNRPINVVYIPMSRMVWANNVE